MRTGMKKSISTLYLMYCVAAGTFLVILLHVWLFGEAFGYPWPGEAIRIHDSSIIVERRACVVRSGWRTWIGATRGSSFATELASSSAVYYETDGGSGMSAGTVSGDLSPKERETALALLKEHCSFLTRWLYLRAPREDWEPYLWIN
jgi:hypothetical protein